MLRSIHKKRFWERVRPVPPELTLQVGIKGIPEVRFWSDEWPPLDLERFKTYTDDDFRKYYPESYGKAHHYLAISGGSANGSFGAGLFAGWTASGTRPEFTMVNGISTGALTAPFAFLGSDYDDVLKKVYTTTSTKDILQKNMRMFIKIRKCMSGLVILGIMRLSSTFIFGSV
jgi:hypothetical protein